MKLNLTKSFLSIHEFPAIELPKFTLITGLNGAGKSHLLQAISNGSVKVDIVQDVNADVRLFDWNNMVPNNADVFDGRQLLQERENLFKSFQTIVGELSERIIKVARDNNISGDVLGSVKAICSMTLEDIEENARCDRSRAIEIRNLIKNSAVGTEGKLFGRLGNEALKLQLTAIASERDCPVMALNQDDLFLNVIPSWGTVGAFQQSLARLFVAYRDQYLENSLRQNAIARGRTDVSALSDEQFVDKFKIPPWDFVNSIFETSGLDFKINRPDEFRPTPYKPSLRKISNNAEVEFSTLSSGEKILMSFALCLYYAEDKRQISTYPKLLLLDEIDAPLHPSMSRNLIRTITDVLVEEHGICVIATTHSPSTVAMSPEDAVFVMEGGSKGLVKTTKAKALNILTDGVPTLSVSYDGRRQVFVESHVDAEIYDSLYVVLKKRLGSERSLHFIETGPKLDGIPAAVNMGREIVKQIVERLVSSGNGTVFGLIDWDGENVSTSQIAVVAEGRRNGIESVILDPVLIACLLVRGASADLSKLGLEGISYRSFCGFDAGRFQSVVSAVQKEVLGRDPNVDFKAAYLDGMELLLDSEYVKIDDHKLEAKLFKAFPTLNAVAKQRGGGELMKYMASVIMADCPHMIPIEVFEVFHNLLNRNLNS